MAAKFRYRANIAWYLQFSISISKNIKWKTLSVLAKPITGILVHTQVRQRSDVKVKMNRMVISYLGKIV